MSEVKELKYSDFFNVFDEQLQHHETYRQAYESTEERFEERFGERRYSSYESFKVVNYRRHKKRHCNS